MTLPRLIYKGAEAEIYLEYWHEELVIRKSRMTKAYRIRVLDEAIRTSRTSHEANMMHEVRKFGVSVPIVQHVDTEASTLIMDFVPGPTLKEELFNIPMPARRSRCNSLGKLLAEMHEGGAVHGDMTISNVLSEDGRLSLIDFGLSDFSDEIEDRGVDLLLLNRALRSTHYNVHVALFNAFFKGYSTVVGKTRSRETLRKMREIERRGRYFERS
jgi:TP53 regulating kinase-like protein